jgi:hypothetical protein
MRRSRQLSYWMLAGLIGIASTAVAPPTVRAEDWLWTRGEVDVKNRMRRHHGGVGAELATYAGDVGDGRALLQSPVIGFWHAFSNHFVMSVDWGMAYYRENVGGQSDRTFRFGAPYLAGYYVGKHGNLKLRLGMALGIPAAVLPDGGRAREVAHTAYTMAAASRGGWNIWMWIPEAATLAFPARLELAGALPHLLLAADVTMGIPIFLRGQGAGFGLQFAGEVGYKSKHVSLGGRLSHLWWAADTPFLPKFFQMALEPFIRVDFGKPFLQARLTMNLNDPWGYAFDGGGIWGFHIGGGTQF